MEEVRVEAFDTSGIRFKGCGDTTLGVAKFNRILPSANFTDVSWTANSF